MYEKLEKIKGIRIEQKSGNRAIVFDSNLSSEEIEKMLQIFYDSENPFSFHDKLYPSGSDPGAYISYFRKTKGDTWKMTLGNHGWTGGIYTIDKEIILKQLNNLIHASLLNEIQVENVVTFSHYDEETVEKNRKQNEYLNEIHKLPNTFLERSVTYKYDQQKGFPKISDEEQCKILLSSNHSLIQNLFPELKNEPFPMALVKQYITIDRKTFAEYFKNSSYIERNIKEYLGNPSSDGMWVLRLKNGYKLIFQERGTIYGHQSFEERVGLEERLITLLYIQYGE